MYRRMLLCAHLCPTHTHTHTHTCQAAEDKSALSAQLAQHEDAAGKATAEVQRLQEALAGKEEEVKTLHAGAAVSAEASAAAQRLEDDLAAKETAAAAAAAAAAATIQQLTQEIASKEEEMRAVRDEAAAVAAAAAEAEGLSGDLDRQAQELEVLRVEATGKGVAEEETRRLNDVIADMQQQLSSLEVVLPPVRTGAHAHARTCAHSCQSALAILRGLAVRRSKSLVASTHRHASRSHVCRSASARQPCGQGSWIM